MARLHATGIAARFELHANIDFSSIKSIVMKFPYLPQPSCGWNDKGPVNKPVDTCEADGVRVIDVNAQSGCNGGSKY